MSANTPRKKITMGELREALRAGEWRMDKASMFFLNQYDGVLKKPTVVIKAGTVVTVVKVYRRGRAALLRYTDRTGKDWWSWAHASEYEAPRKYTRRNAGGQQGQLI